MSRNGHAAVVKTFPMAAGRTFARHRHERHQIAWAPTGVLTVATDASTWVLPPTRALWIPADLEHETSASGPTRMQTAYLRPERCRVGWPVPTPLRVGPLMTALIDHLEDPRLDGSARSRAERVLIDVLEPVRLPAIERRLPVDPRAHEVAAALEADPADRRTLAAWGREVGASERTLARAFSEETGIPFGRWRTQLRLQVALVALAAGDSVTRASAHAGYSTASAFVSAFRRETGLTPTEYHRG